MPPTQLQFLSLIREKGASEAARVFNEVKANSPEYHIFEKLEWRVLLSLGEEYIEAGKYDEAIKILMLNLEVYPDWYQTHYALARAWNGENNTAKAIYHLKECLQFHPRFEEAQKMLSDLGQKPDNPLDAQILSGIEPYLGQYQYEGRPETGIRIFLRENALMCEFLQGNAENHLIPNSKTRFLLKETNGQFFFEFDEEEKITGMRMLGLNSGRFGEPRYKVN